LNETNCFTFHLLARFPTKWQHIGIYACWIDCPIDHKVRTRSTGEIFVRMTKYIAPRMLDVHGRSIIEWHVIDSPNVRWNEVHRFGCVIRLHVNLYMAYCRKNISRPCWREIYLISKSNTKLFYNINTNHILWKNNTIWFIFHILITYYSVIFCHINKEIKFISKNIKHKSRIHVYYFWS